MQRYMVSDSAWDSAVLQAMLLSVWHWHDVLQIDPVFFYLWELIFSDLWKTVFSS